MQTDAPEFVTLEQRRRLLQAGAWGLLPGLHATAPQQALADTKGPLADRSARRCILIYLLGGPSHIDMWDLKPDAPREIRGPFQPISTSVPGTQFGEHLPKLARRADRLAVVRSLTHPNNDHPYMTYYTLTGRISPVPLGANTVLPPGRNDHPHMGSVVARFHHDRPTVPGYVAIPEVRVRMNTQPVAGGGRAGYLGPQFDPLAINEDPRQRLPTLDRPQDVSADRFQRRTRLLTILDGQGATAANRLEYAQTRTTALELTRATAQDGLLDLDAESDTLRDAYGRDRFGQSLLLARRLVQRGVSFVGVHFNYMSKCDGWDTHKNNFKCLQNELLPMLDRGVSALLDDLHDRGLLDDTLVVTMGEFGRTPKINGNAGRDHWGACGSLLMAGAGVQGGRVVGASDRNAAYPTQRPVTPPDVTSTIFHALKIDPHQVMYDRLKRPLPLSTGQPIHELF